MSHPTQGIASVNTPRRMGARPLPRWLLVAGAVALIGVSIDLYRGPPASALPAPASQVFAPMDHSAVTRLADEQALEPGASVASYELSSGDASAPVPVAAAAPVIADDTLEAGASIAAYER